ncbi:MAG: T9SS type A sorting domain-containing protein [Cytophagales bacterium]|nr:T9SS type A sorting domain-containing protein [Cytophagales bacterium]
MSYSTTDSQPYYGLSYYRLKQTDFDGQSSYSKVVTIRLEMTSSISISIYPNPANDILTITGNETDIKDITILNLLGQDVTQQTKLREQSQNRAIIDISSLAMGMYFIQTKAATTTVYKQ